MLFMDALEILHIARLHLNNVIIAAREQLAGYDIRAFPDRILESAQRILALTIKRDVDEHIHPVTERSRVDPRGIALQYAGVLQLLDPSRAGGRRQADTFRQRDLALARIADQLSEDTSINGINFDRHGDWMFRLPQEIMEEAWFSSGNQHCLAGTHSKTPGNNADPLA